MSDGEGEALTILMADDDPDDRLLARRALEKHGLAGALRTVGDGEELMDYLHRRGAYADPALSPRPSLVLLDLNMPRKDGREALAEMKGDPALRQIPVVVLTTSRSDEEIFRRTEALLKTGIRGIVYGRNVIQHPNSAGITRALMAMVHDKANAAEAMKQLQG